MSISYTVANPQTIITNLVTISGMMEDIGIFLGLMVCLLGFFQFKRYGESRTMMSGQHSIAGPLVTVICGIMLMALVPMIQLFSDMFIGTPELISYTGGGGGDYNTVQMVITFVRVIGIGAMINGIMKLSRCGSQNSQHGNASKALFFIVGGIACLNCVAMIDLILNLFDMPSWSG